MNIKDEKHDYITGRILPDGGIIELVHDRARDLTLLLHQIGDSVQLVETLPLASGLTLHPVPADNNLIIHKVVVLPEAASEFGEPADLAASVRAFINRYVTLPDTFLEIATYYVLLSWLYDAFNELPYLRFRGEYGSGKTRALSVIGHLLYKPVFASGATTVSPIFYSLDLFRGSLVFDEADFRFSDERAEVTKILNNGNQAGFPVLRSVMTAQKTYNPRAFHVFGPKVISMRDFFQDQALESRCLSLAMSTVTLAPHIPVSLPETFHSEARALSNQLLSYRLRYRRVTKLRPERASPALSARSNQVILPLLSLIDDDTTRERIVNFMHDQESQRIATRLERIESVVLEALSTLALQSPQNSDAAAPVSVAVGDLRTFLLDEHGSEFERPPTARFLGNILRTKLGLATWKSHGVYRVGIASLTELDRLRARHGLEERTIG